MDVLFAVVGSFAFVLTIALFMYAGYKFLIEKGGEE